MINLTVLKQNKSNKYVLLKVLNSGMQYAFRLIILCFVEKVSMFITNLKVNYKNNNAKNHYGFTK